MNIKIEPLTLSNFNEHSLDDFRRRQQVTEVWRRNGNEMELVYQPFVEDWDADVRREAAERMLGNLRRTSSMVMLAIFANLPVPVPAVMVMNG